MSQENGKAEQTADLSYSNLSEPLTSSAGKMHESDASAENMPTLKPTFFAALSITDHGTVPKNRDFDAIEANAAPESFVKETSSTFAKMKNTLEVMSESAAADVRRFAALNRIIADIYYIPVSIP